jgi:lysyl-tRNA synthetase, class II
MMDLTERMIVNAIEATGGELSASLGRQVIDFTPPFARRTYDD